MASSIQLLRSTIAQERPFSANLLEGQPAVNLNASEPGLFFKAADGSLVKFGPAAITSDGSPPNSSPQGSTGNTIGELWLDKSVNPAVLKVYDGTVWVDAGSGGGGGGGGAAASFVRWIYTAAGGETSLSGSSGGVLLDYTPGLEEVYVNGVLITRGTDYSATNGTSITNLAALTAGDVITVMSMNPVETVQLPGQVTLLRWTVLAAGGQTVLSGVDSSGQQLAYTPGLEEVYVNGAFLRRGTDYTATDGLTITGLSPLTEDDEITVMAWTPFSIADSITDADVAADAAISSTKLNFLQSGVGSVSRAVQNKLREAVSVKDFGAVGDGTTDDLAAFNAAVASMNDDGVLIIPTGTYYLSDLWHVNRPISIDGQNSKLIGGGADGVVWYGYRVPPFQNSYFAGQFVKNLRVTSTVSSAPGFSSSKSLVCVFENLIASGCAGKGLVFGAAVVCTFSLIRSDGCGSTGIEFTSFTNTNNVTHVPCTANSIFNLRAVANGTVVTDYGVLFGLNPSGSIAAYGNVVVGGQVEANNFTGMRIYGYNQIRNVWFETNGKDPGFLNQYNIWISGDNVLIDGGVCQGAGVHKKIFIDSNVDSPRIENVFFNGSLQPDISLGSNVTNFQIQNNRYSGFTGNVIEPINYDYRKYIFGTYWKNSDTSSDFVQNGTLSIPTNSTGSVAYYPFATVGTAGLVRLSATIYDDGTPPTNIQQIVDLPITRPSVTTYYRFISNQADRYDSTSGNSANPTIPVIRVLSNGSIQFQQNNGSGTRTLAYNIQSIG